MRRAVECRCGEHVEAQNDTALLDAFRRHVQEDHPEWSEAEVKGYLVANAYDQVPEGAST